jgi:hypothetical protein
MHSHLRLPFEVDSDKSTTPVLVLSDNDADLKNLTNSVEKFLICLGLVDLELARGKTTAWDDIDILASGLQVSNLHHAPAASTP